MDNRLRKISKIFMLIFTVLFFNCENENDDIVSESSVKFTKRTISLENFKNKKFIKEKLQKLSRKKISRINNRLVLDEENQLYLETSLVNLVETGEYHWLTFKIYRNNQERIENLVLKYNVDTETYSSFIVTYNLDSDEILEINNGETNIDLSQRSLVTPLDSFDINFISERGNGELIHLGHSLYLDPETLECFRFGSAWESEGVTYVSMIPETCPVFHDNEIAEPEGGNTGGGNTVPLGDPGTGSDNPSNPENPNNPQIGGGIPTNINPINIIATNPNIATQGEILVAKLDAVLDLTEQEKDWINNRTNFNEAQAIIDYLQANSCDSFSPISSQINCDKYNEFAKLALEAIIYDGEFDKFNNVILDSTVKNNQKVKCVYDKLKSLSNTIFKDIISDYFGSSNLNNVKITIGNIPTQISGSDVYTYTDYNINNPIQSPGYTKHIRLSSSFVQNASTIEIALTLIHEMIHAELIDRCIKLGIISQISTLGYTVLSQGNMNYTIDTAIFNAL